MLIGFDASRAFVSEATGTENYSYNLLLALTKIDTSNKYRVYVRTIDYRLLTIDWPQNFEIVKISWPYLWTQIGLALETWKNPTDILFVPAHTLPLLGRRGISKPEYLNSKQYQSKNKQSSKSLGNSIFGSLNLFAEKIRLFRIWDLGFRISRFLSKRTAYVVTIHDLGVEYLPQYHQFPQRYYIDLASKFAARTAGAIIAVSAATKDDLVHRYKVSTKKVFVVHEGVDTGFFRPTSIVKVESIQKKYNISKNYVLFVGTVQPRKNLETLIKSFEILVHSKHIRRAQYKQFTVNSSDMQAKKTVRRGLLTDDLQLVIAGKLGWDYQEILDLPEKLGIADRVKFLGYVERDDLPTLYSGAGVFAFPSLFEGFGLPILEALACGCPVVASDIAVHREIRKDLINPKSEIRNPKLPEAMVLAKVESTDEWARFLYQSITLNNNISEFKLIHARLASKLSWLATAKSTLEVFEDVLR